MSFQNQQIKRVAVQVELADGEIVWMYSECGGIEIDVEAVPGKTYFEPGYLTAAYADSGHYNVTLSYLKNFKYGAHPPVWEGREIEAANTIED